MGTVPMSRLPPPVRLASWLVGGCALLSLVDALATLVVLRRFDLISEGVIDALGGPESPAAQPIMDGRLSLLNNVLVGFGLTVVLAALGLAVRRRDPRVRLVNGTVMSVVALFLMCGIAAGPEALISPTGLETPAVRRAMESMLPLWFSALHGAVVAATFAAMGAVAVLLSKESAVEYYRRQDRLPHWRGFTSWLDLFGGRPARNRQDGR